jgi:hypothetical protein
MMEYPIPPPGSDKRRAAAMRKERRLNGPRPRYVPDITDNLVLLDGTALTAADTRFFTVPSAEDIAALRPGDLARVCVMINPPIQINYERMQIRESFWILISAINGPNGESLTGTILDELRGTRQHGLHIGMLFVFLPKHVLSIMRAPDPVGPDTP